ncbi:hypothetical protein ABAC460_05360 [Asticcacaulis sp. AC460]|uniref:beta strand repeat-containing protein n=1 Tax=Asticcacaulis sp. AC460 TaxID=1282360 RepID=UPI0003C3F08A|nr:cadherin-like domain-containing protein [Asticcacaulis sp. AC460]ESQ91768.1 hypothetical protein ABAC460_05360 [Asticcacaulis sp. AC460]
MKKTQFGFGADETDGLAATPQTRAVLNDVTVPSMAAQQLLSSSVKASIFSAPPAATLDYVAGSESRVNTYTTNDQYYPYIAALTGGGYVVVWASAGQDGDGYGIYAQRYNASGVVQGSEVHVSTAAADVQSWPAAVGMSDGSYVVIWHSNNQDGGAYGVYMQRYNASGVAQGTETRVNTTTAGEQSFPAVAALSGGGYVVSWQSPDASGFGIYSQRYNNSGVAQGAETAVNTTTANNQRNPGAASLSNGGYVVTWESSGTDGSGFGIYAQRYNASGVAQGSETRVNTYTSGDQYRSAAIGLSGGGYVIVWESSDQDGDDFGIYIQRFNASGVAQGSETRVNTTTAGLQSFPWISTLSDGGFVVAWYGLNTTGSYEVYAQRYNATGVAQGSESIINTTTSGAQVNPIVATLVNGDYVVAWASAGQDGDGQGIYRKHLQANYEPVLTGTATTLAAGNEDSPYSVTRAQLVAGFTDQDGETLDVSGLSASSGTVVNNGDGTWTMTPTANFNGTMTLTYSVTDGLESTAATLTYAVNAVNDAPAGTPTGTVANGVEDTTQTILATTLLQGLSDVEGQALSVSAISADHGPLSTTDGGWIFTPTNNYNGSVTLSYSVTDGTDVTSGFTRTFSLNAANDAPAGTPTGVVADGSEDTAQLILESLLLEGLTDVDGQTLTVSAISVDHGTLIATTGGWTFTSAANYHGAVTLTYSVTDGTDTLSGLTRTFTLASVNDSPVGVTPVLASATEDVAYTVTNAQLLNGFTDVDGDTLSVQNFAATYSAGYVGGTPTAGTAATANVYSGIKLAGGNYVESYRYYSGAFVTVSKIYDTANNLVATINAGGTMVALADGSFVILTAAGSSQLDAYATRYSATGTVLNSQVALTNSSAFHEQYLAATGLSDGGYALTWTQYPIAGGNPVVKFRTFNADGTPSGSEVSATSGAGNAQVNSQVVQLSNGTIVVSWSQDGADGSGYGVLAQRFTAAGTSLGDATVVNTLTANQQHGVRMTALSGGGYVVSWSDNTAWARKFQVYDASGVKVGTETTLANTYVHWLNNQSVSLAYVASEISALPDGGFVIASCVTDGKQFSLFRYDASGNLLGSPSGIPTDVSNVFSSNLYAFTLADGSVQVMWLNEGNGNALMNRNFAAGDGGTATVSFNSGTNTYSITRPADTNGLLTISYDVSDGQGGTKTISTTLNVNAVNDAPRGSATTTLTAINEDGTIVVTRAQLLAGYSDPDTGANLSIRNNIVTTSSGTVSYNGSAGTWTITPAANYNGTVTLSYTVWDGSANATNGGSLTVTVNAVNDNPTLTSAKATVTGTEDIAKIITLAQLKQGYSDVDGDTLSISGITADHGTVTLNGDGTYTLTPEANYSGTVTLSYTVSDGNGGSLAATLGVSFAAVNDAPSGTPNGTVADGTEDTAQTILAATLLEGFSDVEGQSLSVSAISINHGALAVTTGGWIYTPDANYNGPVTVTFTVSDGNGGTLSGQTRTFILGAVNDAPSATTATFSVSEDGALNGNLSGSDIEGSGLSYALSGGPSHGTLNLNSDGTFTYTPDEDYHGSDSFAFVVNDGTVDSAPATVNLTVTPINDAPSGTLTGTVADGIEDNSQTILAATLLEGLSDVDGDDLTVTAISVEHGTLTAIDGGWTITPDENYNGDVTLTYTVSDGTADVTGLTRTFTLAAVNDAPAFSGELSLPDVAEGATPYVAIDDLLSVVSDVDSDLSITVISVTDGSGNVIGTATGSGGVLSAPLAGYDIELADANYNGDVVLVYTVSDGEHSVEATARYTVTPVNDAPSGTLTGTVADGTEDTSQTILAATLLDGLSDVDGDDLTVTAISVDHGTLTAIDGGWTFTPDENYNGDVTLTYTVSDGTADVTGLTRTFTLAAVNDAPAFSGELSLPDVAEGAMPYVAIDDLLSVVSDVDSDLSITVIAVTDGSGNVIGRATGSGGVLSAPLAGYDIELNDADYNGDVALVYTVSDGEHSVEATARYTVTPVNDAPSGTLTGTVADGTEDTSQTILAATLLEGLSDVDGDDLTVTAISVDHGTLNAIDGGWTFTPDENYNGDVTLTYTVSDGTADVPGLTRTFTLTGVNDWPELVTTPATLIDGIEDTAFTLWKGPLSYGYADPEGESLTVTALSADHATVVGEDESAFTLSLEPDFHGVLTIIYTLSDGQGGTVEVTRTVQILSVPDIIMGTPDSETVTGTADADEIHALAGDDVVDGLGGGDIMFGGAGNDTYIVRDGDVVSEDLDSDGDDGGVDLVRSFVTHALGDYVENLEMLGAGAEWGIGNSLNNRITGSAAANLIDGRAGADTLTGAVGNDTYVVDNTGDVVIEADGDGNDLILSSVSYSLTARYIETLTLTGTANVDAMGNTLANALNGNTGHNRLDGGLGFDTLTGGQGDDTYVVNVAGDIVVEQAGEGTDTVESAVNWGLADHLENLVLTGTAALRGTGNALNNVITGNSGNNLLLGGLGNDTYYVQNTGDNVTELDGEGTDLIWSSVSYNLTGRYVETLSLTGSANIDALGNGLANTLIGNDGINLLTGLAGHDRLDGGRGADTMIGGTGNDTYVVDAAGDVTTENANEGIDLVEARISWSLGANLENLTLIGSGDINATGNAFNNLLTGNGGHNRLDGGPGIDTLAGGGGNDTYVVHSISDVVTENSDEGTDTVESAIAMTLGGNVENLTLTGTATINGTGNALNNVITGNSGANILAGGLGDDTYYIQNAGDNVVELGGEGKDLIYSTVTYTLNQRYVETLVLTGTANINATGNTNANTLVGNDGNNILNGKAGPDRLTGGLGADVFFFELDSAKDTITDFSAAQNDSINIHAFANGAVNAGWVSQIGADTVINLGNGNTITVLNTVQADVLSHIVW